MICSLSSTTTPVWGLGLSGHRAGYQAGFADRQNQDTYGQVAPPNPNQTHLSLFRQQLGLPTASTSHCQTPKSAKPFTWELCLNFQMFLTAPLLQPEKNDSNSPVLSGPGAFAYIIAFSPSAKSYSRSRSMSPFLTVVTLFTLHQTGFWLHRFCTQCGASWMQTGFLPSALCPGGQRGASNFTTVQQAPQDPACRLESVPPKS